MDDVERAFECVAKQFESFLILRVEILMARLKVQKEFALAKFWELFQT